MKYKNRVRSRVSNIGDLKNPGLKQRVISGEITPSRLATMTTEVSFHINDVLLAVIENCFVTYLDT